MFYINQEKKKFVNSVNQIVYNPITLEYAIEDIYLTFKVRDKNSREITLNDTDVFYLAVSTDFLPKTPIVYSSNFTIESNAVTFKISTNTEQYVNDIVQNNSNVNIEIARKTTGDESFHIILQDKILANKRVYVSGQPKPVQLDTYYTKSEVDAELERLNSYIASNYWDKVEVAEAIASANHLNIQVVNTLPDVSNAKQYTVYFVPQSVSNSVNLHELSQQQGGALPEYYGITNSDIYDEYIIINHAWEHIGSTAIDLSGYVTKLNPETSGTFAHDGNITVTGGITAGGNVSANGINSSGTVIAPYVSVSHDVNAADITVTNSITAKCADFGRESIKTSTNYTLFSGYKNTISASYAAAMGSQNIVSGSAAFAAGLKCEAQGETSIAIGSKAKAVGKYSIALGYGVISNINYQIALGRWNAADNTNMIVVGGGDSSNSRVTVATLSKQGDLTIAGKLNMNNHAPNTAGGVITLDGNGKLSADLLKEGDTVKLVSASEKTVWNNKQDTIQDLAEIRSNATAGVSALKAVADLRHIEAVTKPIADYISNSTVTIDDLKDGVVIAVVNEQGKQIYPDIEYRSNAAIISADLGSNAVSAETWTIFKQSSAKRDIDPFETVIEDAELFGKATSISDYGIDINDNDKVVYWTKNSVIPNSGNVFWCGAETNKNLWLKIEDGDFSNAVFYGLAENQVLNGDIHILAKNTHFKNAAFAGNKKSVCNNLEITLDNVTTSGAVYASFGYVNNGDLVLNVKNSTINRASELGCYYRNKAHNFEKANNIYATYSNTDFTLASGGNNYHVLAGFISKSNTNTASAYTEVNDIFVTLNEGNVFNTQSGRVLNLFAGGHYNDSNNVLGGKIHDIYLKINGGTYFDYQHQQNAQGIFAGPLVSNKSKVQVHDINIEVNGGETSTVFAGAYTQQDGIFEVLDDVKITINGGIVGEVLGLSTTSTSEWAGTGYVKYYGNVYIYINGGEVGYVHPGERHADTSTTLGNGKEQLLGEGHVILSGTNDYSTKFQGNILHQQSTSAPANYLEFDNYRGVLSGNVIGFANIEFRKNSSASFTGSMINNTSAFDVDISRRSIDYADTPVFTGYMPNTINLTIGDTETLANWIIADAFPVGGVSIYYGGAKIAEVSTVNSAISGTNTDFDGWGFAIVNNKLVFKQL